MYDTKTVDCPWCGSQTDITADCSAGSQVFVEDCMVCCAPILVHLDCDPSTGEMTGVTVIREND
jgi:hypothetical protein